jgi:hypothetical protein
VARSRRTSAMLVCRCCWDLSGSKLQRKTKSHKFSGLGGRKLRTASSRQASSGSFDSAPPSAVSPDKSANRSAQDDEFLGGLKYNWSDMQKHQRSKKSQAPSEAEGSAVRFPATNPNQSCSPLCHPACPGEPWDRSGGTCGSLNRSPNFSWATDKTQTYPT